MEYIPLCLHISLLISESLPNTTLGLLCKHLHNTHTVAFVFVFVFDNGSVNIQLGFTVTH
jgi:hypothetical protein